MRRMARLPDAARELFEIRAELLKGAREAEDLESRDQVGRNSRLRRGKTAPFEAMAGVQEGSKVGEVTVSLLGWGAPINETTAW